MSRAGQTFLSVWQALAEAIDFTTADLTANAALKEKMLARFNNVYENTYARRAWEDAIQDGELEVTERMLGYDQVEDGRRFEFWSVDPRVPGNCAREIACSPTKAGITLGSELETVYAFWVPKVTAFTLTEYAEVTEYAVGDRALASDGHVYRCVTAGAGNDPAGDAAAEWVQVPVLDVLAGPVIELAAARYCVAIGKFDSGNERRQAALVTLDRESQLEASRRSGNGNRLWVPCCAVCE